MEEGDWTKGLKRIEYELYALDAIPQLGPLPPFPYDTLAETLRAQFNIDSLTFTEGKSHWTTDKEAQQGLGDPITHITLAAPPFEGDLFFSLATKSLQQLMHALLGGDPYAAALYDSDLREGFIQFLCAEVLKGCKEVGYPIVPMLASQKSLPQEPYFVRDLTIDGLLSPIHARLLLTKAFCTSVRTQYEEKRVPLSPEVAAHCPITLSAEIGESNLSQEEWSQLEAGDFVSLDACTYDPATKEGTARITLQGQPLLQGDIGMRGVTVTAPFG